MRMIRSFICVSMAMAAVALCASMPAAAVPINPGITASVTACKDYPAPVAIVVDEAIIQVSEAPAIEGDRSTRSSIAANVPSLASISGANPSLIGFIPPDGRMRC